MYRIYLVEDDRVIANASKAEHNMFVRVIGQE